MLITWLSTQHSKPHSNRSVSAVLTIVRAVWSGSRIIFQQVSPESNSIFDFIMALYNSCDGDWERLACRADIDFRDVQLFLDYAALFLSNMGNYYVRLRIGPLSISNIDI